MNSGRPPPQFSAACAGAVPTVSPGALGRAFPALAAGAAGLVLFQVLGNSTRGYIDTASLFRWWFHQWINPDSESQHGLLILALSVWLFLGNMRGSAGAPAGPEAGGGVGPLPAGADGRVCAALLGGLALHAAGFVAQQARLSIAGLLLYIWGCLGLLPGARVRRAAAFPLLFMGFAVPVNALDSVGFWMRLWVVDASSWLIHLAGIPVIRTGTRLVSADGRYDYDVAAACSGVRSLAALAALSLLVAYLRLRPAWLRAALLLLCGPLAFLGNLLRICAIVVAAQAGGAVWGDRAHEVMGYGVFLIVLAGVIGAAEGLARLRPAWTTDPGRSGRSPGSPLSAAASSAGPGPEGPGGVRRPGGLAALTVAAAAAVAALLVHVAHLPDRGAAGVLLAPGGVDPVELPSFIGLDWAGHPAEVTAVERAILPADTGFSRKLYVGVLAPHARVFLSVVLSGRDRTSIHRPEICLVGQGWTIASRSQTSLRIDALERAGPLPVTLLHVSRDAVTRRGTRSVPGLIAYTFVGADRIIASHLGRLVADAWNRLAHGRADRWAYILVQADAQDGEPAALERIRQVLDGALPVLLRPPPRQSGGQAVR